MKTRATLLNFSRGEVAPEIEARFDLSVYQAGCRTATNVRVCRTGGLTKRMGTRFVAKSPSSPAKLIAFQFNDAQAYAHLFAQGKLLPMALGGRVLEEGLSVSNITNAANALITSAYHGYSVGDEIYLTGITGMTGINDRFLTILTVPTTDTFTVNYNSTSAGAFTGSGGGTVRAAPPIAPPPPPIIPPIIVDPPPPIVGGGGNGGYDLGGRWAGGSTVNPY